MKSLKTEHADLLQEGRLAGAAPVAQHLHAAPLRPPHLLATPHFLEVVLVVQVMKITSYYHSLGFDVVKYFNK